MTPDIVTRSFTNDQYVFDNVFFNNLYKIKGEKDSNRIFVDLGAHAGYFTFCALNLGAKKVYCFEPFVDSFRVLLQNCYNPNYAGRITPYQVGVYTEKMIGKFSIPKLVDGIYFDMKEIKLISNEEEDYYPAFCATLDEILSEFCYGEKINILKINIGYAEKEILLSSSLLEKNVDSVCGEVCINDNQLVEFKKQMGIKGFVNAFTQKLDDDMLMFWFSKFPLSENFVL